MNFENAEKDTSQSKDSAEMPDWSAVLAPENVSLADVSSLRRGKQSDPNKGITELVENLSSAIEKETMANVQSGKWTPDIKMDTAARNVSTSLRSALDQGSTLDEKLTNALLLERNLNEQLHKHLQKANLPADFDFQVAFVGRENSMAQPMIFLTQRLSDTSGLSAQDKQKLSIVSSDNGGTKIISVVQLSHRFPIEAR